MKILIVVPPLTGHINPAIEVARRLAAQGHEIVWAAHLDVLRKHLPRDEAEAYSLHNLSNFDMGSVMATSHTVKGLASVKYFYDSIYLPLAEYTYSEVLEIAEAECPDFIISDHQMLSGALVAHKMALPWVTLITTSASTLRILENIEQWIYDKVQSLGKRVAGIRAVQRLDFSPFTNIVFSSRELVGENKELIDAPLSFVGPCVNSRRPNNLFDFSRLDPNRKKIFVSLGTVSLERTLRFYQVVMEALANEDVQVIMAAQAEWFNEIPDNFIVESPVPQVELLKHMDLVVSHAGHNTVCETLSEALPMVLAPIRDDQPVIAQQVVAAGAGLTLRFGKVSAAAARDNILLALSNASYRKGAEKIRQSFRQANREQDLVKIIENLYLQTCTLERARA